MKRKTDNRRFIFRVFSCVSWAGFMDAPGGIIPKPSDFYTKAAARRSRNRRRGGGRGCGQGNKIRGGRNLSLFLSAPTPNLCGVKICTTEASQRPRNAQLLPDSESSPTATNPRDRSAKSAKDGQSPSSRPLRPWCKIKNIRDAGITRGRMIFSPLFGPSSGCDASTPAFAGTDSLSRPSRHRKLNTPSPCSNAAGRRSRACRRRATAPPP
ncbi:hypothetical protein OpiT1DRAFT_01737 [Opitutaceae bacterium TAV1]|nr:hypothetical protein OpiT1DRAFT_01737 [Opitutaceae bacterium TAV1]